jgi:ribosomal protein S18 acetylase RimI-like enzyme
MITFRNTLKADDAEKIKDLLFSTDFFYDYEIDVALELVTMTIEKGDKASGYYFLIAEEDGVMRGFCNFGPTPCTEGSFDLYWIAVHKHVMNKGLGGLLLEKTESAIKNLGGTNIWVETASRPQYNPTRRFYEKNGYVQKAQLPDFYSEGDDKVVYLKKV